MSAENVKRERARVEREMSLLELVLGREIRQERVHVDLVEDIDLDTLQSARGRVYALAITFNPESANFWSQLFDDLEYARPPVFGVSLPVGLDHVPEEIAMEEVPLVLPLQGVSFLQVAEIKNALFSRIMSGRR